MDVDKEVEELVEALDAEELAAVLSPEQIHELIPELDDRQFEAVAAHNASPGDGRVARKTRSIRQYFSEGALDRYRAKVEAEHLISLSETDVPAAPTEFSAAERRQVRELAEHEFSPIQAILWDKYGREEGEPALEHDVKAVEEHFKEVLEADESLSVDPGMVHFGLTSMDVDNLAWNLMLRDTMQNTWLPTVLSVTDELASAVEEYADSPVLGKTHYQPAAPVTTGKRAASLLDRFVDEFAHLDSLTLSGKFAGAVGSHNELDRVPGIEPASYARDFVASFGFDYVESPGQINPHQAMSRVLGTVKRFNTIGVKTTKDFRLMAGEGEISPEAVEGEVGSSAMPHKVNPWQLEVAEGYFQIANTLIDGATYHLIETWKERDLTDAPWERMYGPIMTYSLAGFTYMEEFLDRIDVNETGNRERLADHPESVSSVFQTVARGFGYEDAYEAVKKATRDGDVSLEELYHIVEEEFPGEAAAELKELTPAENTGRAAEQARESVSRYRAVRDEIAPLQQRYPDTVLFDFDNTLQFGDKDELMTRLNAINDALDMGLTGEDVREIGEGTSDFREMRREMLDRYNADASPEEELDEDDFMYVNNWVSGQHDDEFWIPDGTKEMLSYLREKGVNTGVVTTRGSNSTPRLIDHHGLREYFDVIVDRDDYGETKPHAEPLQLALDAVDADAETAVYVGDKQYEDVAGGNSLNMQTVLVGEPTDDRNAPPPDYVVETPAAVMDLLERGGL